MVVFPAMMILMHGAWLETSIWPKWSGDLVSQLLWFDFDHHCFLVTFLWNYWLIYFYIRAEKVWEDLKTAKHCQWCLQVWAYSHDSELCNIHFSNLSATSPWETCGCRRCTSRRRTRRRRRSTRTGRWPCTSRSWGTITRISGRQTGLGRCWRIRDVSKRRGTYLLR